MSLYSDDNETTTAACGENVKAKLKGVEEEVSQKYFALGRCTLNINIII